MAFDLPLTHLQESFVRQFADPRATQAWKTPFDMVEAIHIKPSISPRKLGRAFDKLLQRHDVLRLTFADTPSGWRAGMFDKHPTGLVLQDHGEADDETISRTVHDIVRLPIEITAPALITLTLLRFGRAGDVVVLQVNHAITDGYGLTLIAEDLIKMILSFPLTDAPMSHADYLAGTDRKQPAFEGATRLYWESIYKPVPEPAPMGRPLRGPLPDAPRGHGAKPCGDHRAALSPQEHTALAEAGSRGNFSVFGYAVAAYADTVHAQSGCDDILVNFVGARQAGDLRRYAGQHVVMPLLRCRRSDGATRAARAAALTKQIRRAFEYPTAEFCSVFDGATTDEIRGAGGWRHQFFVNLSAADGRARASVFAAFLRSRKGDALKIGPLSLRRLAIARPRAALCDLMLMIYPTEAGADLHLSYDTDAHDAGETAEFLAGLQRRLTA